MYWIKTPWWLPKLYDRNLLWRTEDKDAVYLTFDDGPHPTATPFVLQQLDRYHAKATFFCIGKNVAAHPEIFEQIRASGHTVGNHTQNHVNGWKTPVADYIREITEADKLIGSRLFRPPYGRIKKSQAYMLLQSRQPWRIVMWDVLSADFDTGLSPRQCLEKVQKHIRPGAIVVFHDSTKAWDRMSYALPQVLELCRRNHWDCRALPQ